MHYIICISGFAGSGKDAAASLLVNKYGAVQTGLADPGKRHMADAYDFSEQQLFGPSQFRNAGDLRIPKNSFRGRGPSQALRRWNGPLPENLEEGKIHKLSSDKNYWTYLTPIPEIPWRLDPHSDNGLFETRQIFVTEGDPEFWLSPREALQVYLEKMNHLDVYTWIRKGVKDQLLLATGRWGYHRMKGLIRADEELQEPVFSATKWVKPGSSDPITCFADFRHISEIQYIRGLALENGSTFTPVLVRIKRPSVAKPPYNHRSETEQTQIRDAAFDFVVHNDGDLPHLYNLMDDIVQYIKSHGFTSKPWDDSYVVENHDPEEGYIA
jgi:hypothetical protein